MDKLQEQNEAWLDEMRLLLEDKICELIGDFEPMTINITEQEWAIYGISHTNGFKEYIFRVIECGGLNATLWDKDGSLIEYWYIEEYRNYTPNYN